MKLFKLIHIVVAFITLYISYKCNGNKFRLFPTLTALFIPYIYLIVLLFGNKKCLIDLLL